MITESFCKIKALEDLRQQVLNATGCALKDTAKNTVFADGCADAKVMVVGEAPGADEDTAGKPFVGLSGQLLMLVLQSIGLSRESVYITNVVPWRPPLNRQPTSQEISFCLPFLERHIAIIRPQVLLLVGSVACRALMQSEKPMHFLQKENLFYKNAFLSKDIKAFALYHPAYLLRSPSQKRVAWLQMIKLKQYLASLY